MFVKEDGGGLWSLNIYWAGTLSEPTGIEIQSQHWGGNMQLSTEGITIEYFPDTDKVRSNE